MTEYLFFIRSLPWHKNDNPFAEQKNNQYVRGFIGYACYGTSYEFRTLTRAYQVLYFLLDFFCPSAKLIAKERRSTSRPPLHL